MVRFGISYKKVEVFLKIFLYSNKSLLAKEKIINGKYEEELKKSGYAFSKIVSKYNTLFSLAKMTWYTKKELKLLINKKMNTCGKIK